QNYPVYVTQVTHEICFEGWQLDIAPDDRNLKMELLVRDSFQLPAGGSHVCVISPRCLPIRSTSPGTSGRCGMPSSIVRQPATPEDDFRSGKMRGFDQWRIAADIVWRLREAGISCEMDDDFQTRH